MSGAWPPQGWLNRGVAVDAPIVPVAAKFPGATLDYTLALPCAIDPAVDFVASATLACAPSGVGEMQISNLTVANDGVTYTASGGQPGRRYRLKASVAMTNALGFEFMAEQPVTAELPDDQPQAPPTTGFGTPIEWSFAPSLVHTQPRNAQLRMWGFA